MARFSPLCFFIYLAQAALCKAEIGDYVDHSFKCPATITCPVVCASSYDACPEQLRCPSGQQLCVDGSCDVFCSDNLVSPCEQDCAPVACPRIVASFDACMEEFTEWYEFECPAEDSEASNKSVYDPSWTDVGFMLAYFWIIANTVGIIAWSWYKYVVKINAFNASIVSVLTHHFRNHKQSSPCAN